MADIHDRLLARLREAEADLDREFERSRERLAAGLDRRRVRLERAVLDQQRRFRRGLAAFFARADPVHPDRAG